MDFKSAIETFTEAWVAASTKTAAADMSQSQALALTTGRDSRTPPPHSPAHRSTGSAGTPRPPTPLPATYFGHPAEESKNGVKSLPVHCMVESVESLQQWKTLRNSSRTVLEVERYVIIPVNTPFQDLVQEALMRMSYPKENASAARGYVVIKNWKPLSFEKITDSPHATVGDILGDLTTVAKIKIQIFRPRSSTLSEMKDKLLSLLLVQSHAMLLGSGCPLDELTLSQLMKCPSGAMAMFEPHDDTRRKFDQWLTVQASQHFAPRPRFHWQSPPPADLDRKVERAAEERVHPALQTVQNQYPTQKTRMRTSFDPELELPRLQTWFRENQHPTRQQAQQFVKELNALESRTGRKPLDVTNVIYWFKNARAALKRTEVRNSLTPGQQHLNGETSSSHSPSSPMYMLKSPGSLRDEEEDPDRNSPSAPLSLTTSGRHSPSHSPRQLQEVKQEPADQETTVLNPSPNPINNNNNNNNKDLNIETSNEDDYDMEDAGSEEEDSVSKSGENRAPEEEQRIHPFHNHNSQELHLIPRSSTAPGFPMVHGSSPNPWFSYSIMNMGHYIPKLGHGLPQPSPQGFNYNSIADERRKRNRTFIDPVSEVPLLEAWFEVNTHPTHNLIAKYTDDLNSMPYRQKFPRLEAKNVQFWFKNRRAKNKRLKMSLFESPERGLPPQQSYHHHHHHLAAALAAENYSQRN